MESNHTDLVLTEHNALFIKQAKILMFDDPPLYVIIERRCYQLKDNMIKEHKHHLWYKFNHIITNTINIASIFQALSYFLLYNNPLFIDSVQLNWYSFHLM